MAVLVVGLSFSVLYVAFGSHSRKLRERRQIILKFPPRPVDDDENNLSSASPFAWVQPEREPLLPTVHV